MNPVCSHPADPDSGGLERGVVQRHGVHLALRLPLFRSSHDFRELRAFQFAGGHLGGGLPSGGIMSEKTDRTRPASDAGATSCLLTYVVSLS